MRNDYDISNSQQKIAAARSKAGGDVAPGEINRQRE